MLANPTAQQTLQPRHESGWRRGLANILRMGFQHQLRWRSLLIQFVIWFCLVNGIMALLLYTPKPDPATLTPEARRLQEAADAARQYTPVEEAAMIYCLIGGMAVAIGAMITMQNVLIDEKKTGTGAWLLSKPVSRTAFVQGKFIPEAGMLLVMAVIIQGGSCYLLLAGKSAAPPLGGLVLNIIILGVSMTFYMTLALMLSTFTNNRGALIGIALIALFGQQMLTQAVPVLYPLLPLQLIMPGTNGTLALSSLALLGRPLPTILPIIATAAVSVVFVGVAIWRFHREEF